MDFEKELSEALDAKLENVVKSDALEGFVKAEKLEEVEKALSEEKETVKALKEDLEGIQARFDSLPAIINNNKEEKMENITLKKAFDEATGADQKSFVQIETKDLNEARDVTGAPTATFGITTSLQEDNPFRRLARVEYTTNTAAKIPFFTPGAGFTKAGADRAGNVVATNTSTVVEKLVQIESYDKLEYVSKESVADLINFDASMINGLMGLATEAEAADHVATIEGVASPEVASLATAIDLDDMRALVFGLSEKYRKNSVIVMSSGAYAQLHTLSQTGAGSDLVWNAKDNVYKLWGRPIVENSDMADPAANAVVAAIADWKRAFVIVDRQKLDLERNMATPGKVGYYANFRAGHALLDPNAIKTLAMAAV